MNCLGCEYKNDNELCHYCRLELILNDVDIISKMDQEEFELLFIPVYVELFGWE